MHERTIPQSLMEEMTDYISVVLDIFEQNNQEDEDEEVVHSQRSSNE